MALRENHLSLLEEFTAVQQALAELATIYHDAPIGLGVIGADFRFQRINARLAELNGAPIEAHLGRTLREMVPQLADLGEGLITRIVESGEPVLNLEVEGETAAQPGVTLSFVKHWSPLRGPDGKVVAVNVVVEEVTARKRAEVALRNSEARLREVLDSISEAFLLMDHDFRIVMMNREALRIDGRPFEDLRGRILWDAWPAAIATPVEAAYRRVMSERVPVSLEHHHQWDSHDVWLDISAYSTMDGIALFYRDITCRKRAEERLRESERRLSTALRAGQLGVFEYSYRPSSYYWDATVRRIWGVRKDDVVTDELFWASLHPDDIARVRYVTARAAHPKGPRRYDVEYRIFRQGDKALRWVKAAADTVFDGEGPARIIGTIHDITERKGAEEQTLILMREVNHRSKNLLAVVQSIAHQMSRNSRPEVFAARFAERLSGLASCQDLLVHSQWRGVDVLSLVKSQLAHYQHLIGQRIHTAGAPLRLTPGAAQNLGMALHELATNAAKYGALSGAGGEVSIGWELASGPQEPEFRISWRESGGPPVMATEHRGLGTQIISRLLERALDGQVVLDFGRAGLSWSFHAPAGRVMEILDA